MLNGQGFLLRVEVVMVAEPYDYIKAIGKNKKKVTELYKIFKTVNYVVSEFHLNF